MSTASADRRIPDPIHPVPNCPSCGSEQLSLVEEVATNRIHFLCRVCKRCWHSELGFVQRVSPEACRGCAHAAECRPVYERDRARGRRGF
jgi:hypothetical protein